VVIHTNILISTVLQVLIYPRFDEKESTDEILEND
jgi:hypothetical protein